MVHMGTHNDKNGANWYVAGFLLAALLQLISSQRRRRGPREDIRIADDEPDQRRFRRFRETAGRGGQVEVRAPGSGTRRILRNDAMTSGTV